MLVKLTRPFFDGTRIWPAGAELDLSVPPKSAIVLPQPEAADKKKA